jgi:sortase A
MPKSNPLEKNKILGLIFLFLALVLFLRLLHQTTPPAKNPIVINSDLYKNAPVQNIPVRVLLPKADIDIPVIPAKIVDGYWELSENTASYGLGSGLPGEKNNTVIFAHARKGLFYNLKDVKTGDIIYVFSENKWFRYKVNKITSVYPDQVEVIKPTKNETLTLYTCTGYNDEKRLIVSAGPVK